MGIVGLCILLCSQIHYSQMVTQEQTRDLGFGCVKKLFIRTEKAKPKEEMKWCRCYEGQRTESYILVKFVVIDSTEEIFSVYYNA